MWRRQKKIMPENVTLILEIIGAISAVGVAFYKWIFIPIKSILAKLDELKTLEAKVDKLDKDNKATMRCLVSMVDHMIEGNHVDKLKQDRDDMWDHIIGD